MPVYEPVRLAEGFSFPKLSEWTGGVQELGEIVLDEEDIEFKDVADSERFTEEAYDFEEYKARINLDVCEVPDSSKAETPFEELASKMTNLTLDGKVKKRMLEAGKDPIPKDGMVYISYDLYLEMQESPFDSSYLRSGKPERFQIGRNNQIMGFDIAVASMRVGEKSQFLIHWDYAFGKLGVIPRIPPEAEIFAVITVVEAVDCGLVLEEKQLTLEEMKTYSVMRPRADAEHNLANDYFKRKKISSAVYHYQSEERMLIQCPSSDPEEEAERKERLFKIYVNMAVCYNHREMKDANKALHALEKAEKLDDKRATRSAKYFYNKGVAKAAKGDYEVALKDLKKAQLIEPRNMEVSKKILSVEEKLVVAEKQEKDMSVRVFGGYKTLTEPFGKLAVTSEETSTSKENEKPESDGHKTEPVEADVKQSAAAADDDDDSSDASDGDADPVAEILEEFKNSSAAVHNLGYGFTPAERDGFRKHCKRLGLIYEETKSDIGWKTEICIRKPTSRKTK